VLSQVVSVSRFAGTSPCASGILSALSRANVAFWVLDTPLTSVSSCLLLVCLFLSFRTQRLHCRRIRQWGTEIGLHILILRQIVLPILWLFWRYPCMLLPSNLSRHR